MPEYQKVDFTIRTLDEHVMARLSLTRTVFLSQRGRIWAPAENQGLSHVLRKTRNGLGEMLSITWFPGQAGRVSIA